MRASSGEERTWLKISEFCPFAVIRQIEFPRCTSMGELQFSKVWRSSPRQSSSVEGDAMKFAWNSKSPGEWLKARRQANDNKSESWKIRVPGLVETEDPAKNVLSLANHSPFLRLRFLASVLVFHGAVIKIKHVMKMYVKQMDKL